MKQILNLFVSAAVSACILFVSIRHSFADMLPTEFVGQWMVYPSTEKCGDAEGISVSQQRVEWNHEATCGIIDSVRRGKMTGNVTVNMTCVDAEGWINGRPRPPRTFRDTQIWFFKVGESIFMTQTSMKDKSTDLFKKCD